MLVANLTLSSVSFRHGLRFGGAIAVGVATYKALGIEDHGFWIPLTILFVLRPEEGETMHRLALRAAGTALGLALATGVSELLGGAPVAIALALAVAAALSYGMLTVQYALFTAAITVYAVVLASTLGEGAWHAADLRALGTVVGIAIAGGAFLIWSNPAGGGRFTGQPANLAAGAAEEGRGS